MSQRLLEGGIFMDDRDNRIEELEMLVRAANDRATNAERDAVRARQEAQRALGALRTQLTPLYRALQAVFGELDTVTEDGPAAPVNSRTSAVWDAWKSRLPPACGRIIDALLVHGDLNGQQICVAAQMAKKTMYDSITRLNKAGVLTKNGGRFQLKQL